MPGASSPDGVAFSFLFGCSLWPRPRQSPLRVETSRRRVQVAVFFCHEKNAPRDEGLPEICRLCRGVSKVGMRIICSNWHIHVRDRVGFGVCEDVEAVGDPLEIGARPASDTGHLIPHSHLVQAKSLVFLLARVPVSLRDFGLVAQRFVGRRPIGRELFLSEYVSNVNDLADGVR